MFDVATVLEPRGGVLVRLGLGVVLRPRWWESGCARKGPRRQQREVLAIFFETDAEPNIASQHLDDPMPERMEVRTSFIYNSQVW